ncbi:alpha/beta hydrolase [Rhodobacter sp. Har01]|uniref:alpha/beta hydrolase n=1 Tax=Rhodobacter sp. Har01 TaxID=2883999 RepID=UPI001D05C7ED|nr:alpha/beta hydrolase [Rhodobacter sp. Har01]MCB6176905.1 alpha/beta hydrolase [Rhodobacter sp. Har01]
MTRPPYAWPDPDRDYANGAFIAGGEAYPARWAAEAAAFRAAVATRARLGLPHGPDDRQRFDLFLPEGAPQGCVVFVHGGYWMAFGREVWSHLAAGPLARGWAVALPSYTLAPQARISAITLEIAAACRAVAALVPGPLVVAGHSAGGHLAARMGCADIAAPVARVVPISPLAELGPLMATRMNATLRIDPAEAAAESPARLALRPGTSAHVWVGAAERPAFLWQARVLAEEWACPWTVAPDRHHFDVIDALADPGSDLVATLIGR